MSNNQSWDQQTGYWNGDDAEHKRRDVLFQAELAKNGIKYSEAMSPYAYIKDSADRSERLSARNQLRKLSNTVSERVRSKGFVNCDDDLELMDEISRRVAGINSKLDLYDMADSSAPRSGSEGDGWKTNQGDKIHVLNKTQKFSDIDRSAKRPNFGFADCVRAMALGGGNPEIRAALSEGADSAGGFTVPDVLSRLLIDRMRAKAQCIQAGALSFPLQSDQQYIARLESDPTAAWRLENQAIAESDPTFSRIGFTARSLAVLVKISRELLEDNIVNLEDAMLNAFAGSMAVEVDRVALLGSGAAPEPLGIFNNANVNTVSMGANGAALANYAKMLDAILETDTDNAASPTAAIMNPRTWRAIQGFADTTGQPLMPPPALKDLPLLRTTTVPVNQTQGTATNASCIFLGDFSHLLFGVRTGLRVEMLRERFAENHQYAFIAHMRLDVQLVRPESFCVIKGITP